MSPTNDLQQRVKQLEQLLADTRQGLERQRQTRTRIAKALVAVLAVGSLVAGVQEARAWGGCNQFLSSYGLKTFCAGDPALASDINSNFQVLAKDLEAKVGKISDPKVTISGGTATLTGMLTANGGLTVKGDAASSGTVSGIKGTFGSGSSGGTMLGGGNTAGNLHIDATTGATYLNYYAGKGVYFGNGAAGIAASVDAAGKTTTKSLQVTETYVTNHPADGAAPLVAIDSGNDGAWGNWSAWKYCYPGYYVCGFRQKVEANQGNNDDSAVNGVHLACCPFTVP